MPARTLPERAGRVVYLAFCAAVLLFLIAPLLVFVPLSFNVEPYFTFTEGMLRLDPDAYSLRWYRSVAGDEEWLRALVNSVVIGAAATLLATVLGTVAALGLSSPAMPGRTAIMGLLLSPIVTPLIISAVGMFFFYSEIGLAQTHLGLILAHTTLGAPFVVITVTATLSGFDRNLLRAFRQPGRRPADRLPAHPAPADRSRRRVRRAVRVRDLVRRGGHVLFIGGLEQRTIPRQMWSGIREEISPAILAVATVLLVFALLFMGTVEWLRRRGSRESPTV